jgi:hypothetical protein
MGLIFLLDETENKFDEYNETGVGFKFERILIVELRGKFTKYRR